MAGSVALILGAVGGLLSIIWKSRCLCRCRIGLSDRCYIFDCSREPPPLESTEVDDESEEEAVLPEQPKLAPEPEPEPQPEVAKP